MFGVLWNVDNLVWETLIEHISVVIVCENVSLLVI